MSTSLGKKLKSSHNPNETINKYIVQRGALAIYTDGRNTPQGIGYACIAPQINVYLKRRMDSFSSVYTAEYAVLNDALDLAIKNSDRNICIFSDSLSALQALHSHNLNTKTNSYIFKIKQKYNEFLSCNVNNSILTLHWIPSHQGIQGNDEADLFAKSAANSELTDIPKIPFTDFYENFKNRAKKHTTEIIQSQSAKTGKNFFKQFWKNSQFPWYGNKKLNRILITTVNRIRANHYNLASSLFRINLQGEHQGCGS